MFEAFQERDYRRFWTAQFFSNIGSWMQGLAQGWLVYKLTDSPFLLGFVAFANSAPSLFLMLPAGVLADHLDRRRVVQLSQCAQALSALFIAIAIRTGHITVWHIVAASVLSGVAISFSAPAYQAMIIDLLDDRARLSNAVAMNSLQFNLSRVLGPLLAGLTLAAWGSLWCFLLNALSFIPLIFVLGRLRKRQVHEPPVGALGTRLIEGFRYVRGDRVMFLNLAIVAVVSLLGYPYMTLMPMAARNLYVHDDARGLGILMGSIGIGALLGALALSIRTPVKIMRMIIASLAVFGVALGAIGFTHARLIIVPLLAVCGCAMVVSVALCNTSIQNRVPDAMRGRVLSMYTFGFFGFLPFGNLIAGTIAEHRGLPMTMVVLGGGLLAAAGVAAAVRSG
ncbi:MAG TPA: MFS transporter [Thermoanaerobaculia bacterium]|nr:MFS transporter [Thermoanaerobaculia bacterium]